MEVLLIDPPSLEGKFTEVSDRNIMFNPNLGLVYMATYLQEKSDAHVTIVDYQGRHLDQVQDIKPALVGITAKTFNILGAYDIAAKIRKSNPEAIILAGGAHPTAIPQQTLAECPHLDAVVMGEGELTLLDIYNRLKTAAGDRNKMFHEVPGVVWRDDQGQIISNNKRKLIEDLDSLPFPDYSLIDWSKYARRYSPTRHKFMRCYPIFASRGCPFNCTFCFPLLTRKHRARSVDNVLDEIELLVEKYGAERIYFEDSLFYPDKKQFAEFCEKFIRRGLHKKVEWGFETRIDTSFNEMFALAKAAGCIYIGFGVESCSEIILKSINKSYSKDAIISRLYLAKQAGIPEVVIGIIFGLPFETKETIKETISLLKVLPFDEAGIAIMDIYPGTKVFEMVSSGEGGLRWLKEERTWEDCSRAEVAVEVNDLTAADLIQAREEAIRISAEKTKKNRIERLYKLWAYSKELLKEDPKTFFTYLKDVLTGRR